MARMRRLLGPLTAFWLLCQAGTLALVPAILCAGVATAHAAECTCGHGHDGVCPMHHRATGRSGSCAMRSADSSLTAVLTTLAGVTGLLAEPAGTVQPPVSFEHRHAARLNVSGERPAPPDPPPPRAQA